MAPKRRDLSSHRSMRYIVPAAAAVANAAMPTKLNAMCAKSQSPRTPDGSWPGVRPIMLAKTVGSAARGAATSVSDTSCARSSTVNSVAARTNPAKESAGPRPVSGTTPTLRAKRMSAIACTSTPAASNAITPRTGAPTGRANGVAASAAAPMYNEMATKWAIAIIGFAPIYSKRELYGITGRLVARSETQTRALGHRRNATRQRACFDFWMPLAGDHQRRRVRRHADRLSACDGDLGIGEIAFV